MAVTVCKNCKHLDKYAQPSSTTLWYCYHPDELMETTGVDPIGGGDRFGPRRSHSNRPLCMELNSGSCERFEAAE